MVLDLCAQSLEPNVTCQLRLVVPRGTLLPLAWFCCEPQLGMRRKHSLRPGITHSLKITVIMSDESATGQPRSALASPPALRASAPGASKRREPEGKGRSPSPTPHPPCPEREASEVTLLVPRTTSKDLPVAAAATREGGLQGHR